MLISRRVYTETVETSTIRVRNLVARWCLLGIPILTHKNEVWRKAAAVDDKLRGRVLAEDGYMCVYCGQQDRTLLTMDHRVPQVEGGVTHFRNLLTACKSCNSAKCGRTPEEAGMPLVYGRFPRLHKPSRPVLRFDLTLPTPCLTRRGRLISFVGWHLTGLCGLLLTTVSIVPTFWDRSPGNLIVGLIGGLVGTWLADTAFRFGRLRIPLRHPSKRPQPQSFP